jgi:hypothetical protein
MAYSSVTSTRSCAERLSTSFHHRVDSLSRSLSRRVMCENQILLSTRGRERLVDSFHTMLSKGVGPPLAQNVHPAEGQVTTAPSPAIASCPYHTLCECLSTLLITRARSCRAV